MEDSDLSAVPVHAENINKYAFTSKHRRKLVSGINSELLVKFGGVNTVKPYLKWEVPAPTPDGHTDGVAVTDGDNPHWKPEREAIPIHRNLPPASRKSRPH